MEDDEGWDEFARTCTKRKSHSLQSTLNPFYVFVLFDTGFKASFTLHTDNFVST